MRETRVLCRSIRTRSPAWYVNKRLRPCHDAAIFRAYETRALKARRDRFARRYAADVIARATAPNVRIYQCQSYTRHGFSSKIPVSAPEAARNDEIAGWIAMWCVRARYIVNTYIYTYVFTFTRNERRRSFEANAFLCHNLAARAKHPALACQPTCSPPLLGSNSRRSCSTAPNVPKARLYWFRSYENRAIIKDFVCF